MLNARRMNSTIPLRTCVWGVQNTKDHYLGLHCTGESAQDSHDNATLVKHTHSTPVFHTTSKTHNIPHTIARISARTHQSRPGSWPGSTGLASEQLHPKRKWQHTVATHERPTSGSSPKHETLACALRTPPLAQNMPPVCLHQSPSSGAPASTSSS